MSPLSGIIVISADRMVRQNGADMADTSYTVAVQYDDTTDILPVEYSDMDDALWMRNKIADEAIHTQGAWEGLQYVYVIANGRVMV